MSLVAWKQPYLLQVMVDDEPENPRGEEDNIGHMVCWHRRYHLGDEHQYEKPNDFLKELVQRTVSGDVILDYVQSGKSDAVRLMEGSLKQTAEEPAKDHVVSGLRVEGYDRYAKEWYEEDFFSGGLREQRKEIVDCLVDLMADKDLLTLARKENILLPLYLYDHSGLSMSISDLVGHAVHAEWDSGQVGWIYATAGDIRAVYGNVSSENMERAEWCLESEVKRYDYYLSGQCYGVRLYENGEETESIWGFLGNLSDVLKEIVDYTLPEDYQDMVGLFQEVPDIKTCGMGYEDIMGELGYPEPFAGTGLEV